MNGWRVRHGMSGDIPFFVGLVMCAGAALGAVCAFLFDHIYWSRRVGRDPRG